MPEETKPRMIRVGKAWVQPSMILSIEKANGFSRSDGTFVGWIVTLDKYKLGMAKDANPRRWLTKAEVKPVLDFFGVNEEGVDTVPPPSSTKPDELSGEPASDLYKEYEPTNPHKKDEPPW